MHSDLVIHQHTTSYHEPFQCLCGHFMSKRWLIHFRGSNSTSYFCYPPQSGQLLRNLLLKDQIFSFKSRAYFGRLTLSREAVISLEVWLYIFRGFIDGKVHKTAVCSFVQKFSPFALGSFYSNGKCKIPFTPYCVQLLCSSKSRICGIETFKV